MQAHCQSPTSQPAMQSFAKELAKPTPNNIVFKKFPDPSKKIKNATPNLTTYQQKVTAQHKQRPDKHGGQKASLQHGFCVRRADVHPWSFVLLLNFSNKLKLCAQKPARTQSPKTLQAMQRNIFINQQANLL